MCVLKKNLKNKETRVLKICHESQCSYIFTPYSEPLLIPFQPSDSTHFCHWRRVFVPHYRSESLQPTFPLRRLPFHVSRAAPRHRAPADGGRPRRLTVGPELVVTGVLSLSSAMNPVRLLLLLLLLTGAAYSGYFAYQRCVKQSCNGRRGNDYLACALECRTHLNG